MKNFSTGLTAMALMALRAPILSVSSKKHTHRAVGERREDTPERIYNAAGRGNGRRVKPAVRDWMLKKQYMPYGGFELIMVPRVITTVTLINRNHCKRQAHNK